MEEKTTQKIGVRTASTFVIANMIGVGVFTSLGFQLISTTNPIAIALIWLIGGLNMMVLGIVGLYIDRIFNQVKGRPLFIVSETVGID